MNKIDFQDRAWSHCWLRLFNVTQISRLCMYADEMEFIVKYWSIASYERSCKPIFNFTVRQSLSANEIADFCSNFAEIFSIQCCNSTLYHSLGISYPHSRACPLIGSFCQGFTYCDDRERDSDGNIIFRWSFIGYLFVGFHIVVSRNVFLCLTMIQKRKNIKTLVNLIYTRGLRPLVQIR
jgi:hypothetical protein